ncbi:MAG TPA: hypothetical protein PKA82_10020 [Pyrinomonadaceae bacterium]|nr:hypothetical protein [Pyrinomonadaceae bacterium]
MKHISFESGAIRAGDCVSNAWNQMSAKFGLYLGVGLVTYIMVGCIPIVSIFLFGPVMAGFYYVSLKDMRGEPVEFGMLFRGFDKFLPLMIIGLLQSIPAIIIQILRFVSDFASLMGSGGFGSPPSRRGDFFQSSGLPDFGLSEGLMIGLAIVGVILFLISIVWAIVFRFAIPLAMEHDLGVTDAIKLSASAAFSNIGGIILLFLLYIVVALLGVLALCIGIFVAIPVIWIADAFAYRQVFPLIEQRMNFEPPPPTAYGSSFGQGL